MFKEKEYRRVFVFFIFGILMVEDVKVLFFFGCLIDKILIYLVVWVVYVSFLLENIINICYYLVFFKSLIKK